MSAPRHPLLAGSLYAFSLPRELLDSLQLRAIHTDTPVDDNNQPTSSRNTLKVNDASPSSTSLGCAACGVSSFQTVADQRDHFRSDWHRYNVKLRLGGGSDAKPVGEEEFAAMLDCKPKLIDSPSIARILCAHLQFSYLPALSASISGSESSSSSSNASSASSTNAVSRLLRKHDLSKAHLDDDEDSPFSSVPRSPLLWFSADQALVPDTQLGIYRTIFPSSITTKRDNRPAQGWHAELAHLQVVPEVPKSKKLAENPPPPTDFESRTWTMFMVGGGHFAGMVVSLVPKIVNKGGGRMEREEIVLEKKTFHRYTSMSPFSPFFSRVSLSFFSPFSPSEARWFSIDDGQRKRKRKERRCHSASVQRTGTDRRDPRAPRVLVRSDSVLRSHIHPRVEVQPQDFLRLQRCGAGA
jgi:hypothetical protein